MIESKGDLAAENRSLRADLDRAAERIKELAEGMEREADTAGWLISGPDAYRRCARLVRQLLADPERKR